MDESAAAPRLSTAWRWPSPSCRHLIERTARLTLFATHYFELTRLSHEYSELANVHLGAVEHAHRIVFLHAVEEGPANQSYGIQVAALAAFHPPSCALRASSYGSSSSARPSIRCSRICSRRFPDAPEAEPAEPHPALSQLAAIDPDALTPREALDASTRSKVCCDDGATLAFCGEPEILAKSVFTAACLWLCCTSGQCRGLAFCADWRHALLQL